MQPATAKRLWFWLPPLALVALALAWLFRPQPVAVDLATAARGPLRVSVSDDGETRVKDVFVVSAPVAGLMRRIELEAGDPVVFDLSALKSYMVDGVYSSFVLDPTSVSSGTFTIHTLGLK